VSTETTTTRADLTKPRTLTAPAIPTSWIAPRVTELTFDRSNSVTHPAARPRQKRVVCWLAGRAAGARPCQRQWRLLARLRRAGMSAVADIAKPTLLIQLRLGRSVCCDAATSCRVRALSQKYRPAVRRADCVSVIRHFVENPPCSVGLVGGAIRFAIVPPGFCANDGAFKPCASRARAMSLCASPPVIHREGTHDLPTEVETGKADASTSKKCRMDCCFRRSMCSLGL
jgi:hypothetical protein